MNDFEGVYASQEYGRLPAKLKAQARDAYFNKSIDGMKLEPDEVEVLHEKFIAKYPVLASDPVPQNSIDRRLAQQNIPVKDGPWNSIDRKLAQRGATAFVPALAAADSDATQPPPDYWVQDVRAHKGPLDKRQEELRSEFTDEYGMIADNLVQRLQGEVDAYARTEKDPAKVQAFIRKKNQELRGMMAQKGDELELKYNNTFQQDVVRAGGMPEKEGMYYDEESGEYVVENPHPHQGGIRFQVRVQPTERSTVETLREAAERGMQSIDIEQQGFLASIGAADTGEVLEKYKALKMQELADPLPEGSLMLETGKAVAQMSGPMAESMLEGAIIGVGSGTGVVGGLVGTGQYWYRQGAGSTYLELVSQGVDPNIASAVGNVVALPYAAIESAQVGRVKGAVKPLLGKKAKSAVLNAVTRRVKQYLADVGKNVTEEVLQEASLIAAEEAGKLVSNVIDDTNIPYATKRQIVDRIRQPLAPESVMAFGLLSGGHVVGAARDAVSAKQKADARSEVIKETLLTGIRRANDTKKSTTEEVLQPWDDGLGSGAPVPQDVDVEDAVAAEQPAGHDVEDVPAESVKQKQMGMRPNVDPDLLDVRNRYRRKLETEQDTERREEYADLVDAFSHDVIEDATTFQGARKVAVGLEKNDVPFVRVSFDIQNLGGNNNVYGHEKANEHMRELVGAIMTKEVHAAGGMIAMNKGDEGKIYLPHMTETQAAEFMTGLEKRVDARRAELGLAETPHPKHDGMPTGSLGISWGVAENVAGKGKDIEELADERAIAQQTEKLIAVAKKNDYIVSTDKDGKNVYRKIRAIGAPERRGSAGRSELPGEVEGSGVEQARQEDVVGFKGAAGEGRGPENAVGDIRDADVQALADDRSRGDGGVSESIKSYWIGISETYNKLAEADKHEYKRKSVPGAGGDSVGTGDANGAAGGREGVPGYTGAAGARDVAVAPEIQLEEGGDEAVSSVFPQLVKLDYSLNIQGKTIKSPLDMALAIQGMRNPYQEKFGIAVLDGDKNVLRASVLSMGMLGSAQVDMKHVAREIALSGDSAAGFIVFHNHPSGDPSPSSQDRRITRKLRDRAALPMIDHVIINGDSYYSLEKDAKLSLPERALAEWEAVPRRELTRVTVDTFPRIVRALSAKKTGKNVLLVLNSAARIVSARYLPAGQSVDADIRSAVDDAATAGGTGVLLYRVDGDADTFAMIAEELAQHSVQLFDAASEGVESYYADGPGKRYAEIFNGVMEKGKVADAGSEYSTKNIKDALPIVSSIDDAIFLLDDGTYVGPNLKAGEKAERDSLGSLHRRTVAERFHELDDYGLEQFLVLSDAVQVNKNDTGVYVRFGVNINDAQKRRLARDLRAEPRVIIEKIDFDYEEYAPVVMKYDVFDYPTSGDLVGFWGASGDDNGVSERDAEYGKPLPGEDNVEGMSKQEALDAREEYVPPKKKSTRDMGALEVQEHYREIIRKLQNDAMYSEVRTRLNEHLKRSITPEQRAARANALLRIAKQKKLRDDTTRRGILEYARKVGLSKLAMGQVATMIKNARTMADYTNAIKRIDNLFGIRHRRDLVEKVENELVAAKKYIKGIQGKKKARYDEKTNEEIRKYLDELTEMSPQMQEKVEREFNFYQQNPDAEMPDDFPQKIAKMFRRSIKGMSALELEQTLAELRYLKDNGRLQRQAEEEERDRIRDEKVRAIKDELREVHQAPKGRLLRASEERKVFEGLRKMASKLFWANMRSELIIKWFGGWKKGALYDALWRPIWNAEQTHLQNVEHVLNDMKEIHGQFDPTVMGRPYMTLKDHVDVDPDTDIVTQDDVVLSLDKMMFVYANSLNTANRAHLYGTGFTDEEIELVEKKLPEKYRTAVRRMIDYFDTRHYDRLNEVFRREHGISMPKELNYFPIRNIDSKRAENNVAADMMARLTSRWATTQKGFTKGRVHSKAAFRDLNYMETVTKHLLQTERYLAYNTPVMEVARLLNDPELAGQMKRAKEVAHNELNDWLRAVGYGRIQGPEDSQNKVIDYLRRSYVVSVLGYNVVTMTKQAASLPQGMAKLKHPGSAGRAALHIMKSGPKKTGTFIKERSVMMRNRAKSYEREIAEQSERTQVGTVMNTKRFMDRWREHSMAGIQAIDMATVDVLWMARYMEVMEQSGNEQAAIDEADELIRTTQPMGGLVHLPGIMRTTGFARAITMFKNQPNQNLNQLFELQQMWGMRSTKENLQRVFFYTLVPSAVLYAATYGGQNPLRDPEGWIEVMVNNFFGGVPYFNLVAEVATRAATNQIRGLRGKKKKGYRLMGMDIGALSVFGDATRVVSSKKISSKIDAGLAVVAKTRGVPGWAQGRRIVKGSKKALQAAKDLDIIESIRRLSWSDYALRDQNPDEEKKGRKLKRGSRGRGSSRGRRLTRSGR